MLTGLMQNDFPLTVQHLLYRMSTVHHCSEVVTLYPEGVRHTSYGELAGRVGRLAGGLRSLGVGPGDRVATLCWNTQEHLEAYYAVPCMGAVLHTLNLRLHPDQLVYIINHARDRVILVDDSLVALLAPLVPRLPMVERFVVVGSGEVDGLPGAVRYEDLLAGQPEEFVWPAVDERSASSLCYTSGTTGNPKGVLYSHRSTAVYSLLACLPDSFGLRAADRVMPAAPMFHANAWGLPYASALAGASLVLPGRFLQGESLARLIERERVSVSGAVPTIMTDLLRYADSHLPDLSSLRLVLCGGAAVPRQLMQGFEDRHGVTVLQVWGMTECTAVVAVSVPPANTDGEEHWHYRQQSGRPLPFVEARIVSDDDTVLPWDGESTGELQVRGPSIAADYLDDPTSGQRFSEGWLRTGDVAAVDRHGYVRLRDRSKDVIKSGGEWISSVELENAIAAHPGVREAAVIATPDQWWGERPLACLDLIADRASPRSGSKRKVELRGIEPLTYSIRTRIPGLFPREAVLTVRETAGQTVGPVGP
ncbi:long-chain fatty acid--CoA ligase [Mycolicibacterium xanthum]|uniref:long-chain fatty acid--CoA ligase n=1 Tax=Mycolicibacterium xanthum TaxID=2796469 RepID=UPI002104227C|nr:long-chain fatty acid--CoA ligase [Mycolicibacterium xanthum]